MDSKFLRFVNGLRRNSGFFFVLSFLVFSNFSYFEEDFWIFWGRIVNEWEDVCKKKEK